MLCKDQNGLTLPEWTNPVYPQQLQFFYNLMFNTYFVGSEQAIKLTGGKHYYISYFISKLQLI